MCSRTWCSKWFVAHTVRKSTSAGVGRKSVQSFTFAPQNELRFITSFHMLHVQWTLPYLC